MRFTAHGTAVMMLFAFACAPLRAQVDPVPAVVATLTNSVAATREAGFYALLNLAFSSQNRTAPSALSSLFAKYPSDEQFVKDALIAELNLENPIVWGGLGESSLTAGTKDYGDYYADLVGAVASLNDPRSANSLAAAITTGTTVLASLAKIGAPAIDAVTPHLYGSAVGESDAATFALILMVNQPSSILPGDTISLSKIRAGLQKGVSATKVPQMVPLIQQSYTKLPSVPAGDINGDGIVNCKDVSLIRSAFGKSVGQVGFDIRADVNADGVVNNLDLITLRKRTHKELECGN